MRGVRRTLKRETARPPRANLLQHQEAFDAFLDEFNNERPHEALAMKRPADVYSPSTKAYPDVLPEPDYSTFDDVIDVTSKGSIYLYRRKQIYLAAALAGQPVGIREEQDGRWLVAFMHLELGHVETNDTFTPISIKS